MPAFLPAFILDASRFPAVAWILLAAALSPTLAECQTTVSGLQILEAGVQRLEDGPNVAKDYHFQAGDFLYFRFQISGYGIKTAGEPETRSLSLEYQAVPQDASGVALAEPVKGEIKDELSSEDKNWTPKRRTAFLLPSFPAAAEDHIHLEVRDLIGKTSVERDIPFNMGGVTVIPSAGLAIQTIEFRRTEEDAQALELPAYRPGDTVFIHFYTTGFQIGPGNAYDLSYGLQVLRPDGKVFVDQPSAATLASQSFYPAHFLPGDVGVITSKTSSRGQYVVLLTVHDRLAGKDFQVKRSFSLE